MSGIFFSNYIEFTDIGDISNAWFVVLLLSF